METRVLIQSAPKPYAAFPPPQWCNIKNLIKIGHLASEIFKFESVDDDDDGRMDGPLVYYKLTLWAFGSGELKTNSYSLVTKSYSLVTKSYSLVTKSYSLVQVSGTTIMILNIQTQQVCANSVDPDQTASVCHSICILLSGKTILR